MRTRSPVLHTSGDVPGNALAFMVSTLKSVISLGSGRIVPGTIRHSLSRIAKSRSTRYPALGRRGWTTIMPISPIAICVISSWCEWYMNVPCCFQVNSYLNVSPGLIARWVSPPTPSMPFGTNTPCQCTEVGAFSRLVT